MTNIEINEVVHKEMLFHAGRRLKAKTGWEYLDELSGRNAKEWFDMAAYLDSGVVIAKTE